MTTAIKKKLKRIREDLTKPLFWERIEGGQFACDWNQVARTEQAIRSDIPTILDSLEMALQATEDAEFVLEGSRAIEGQSDEILDKRERALQRFLENLNKIKARLGGG